GARTGASGAGGGKTGAAVAADAYLLHAGAEGLIGFAAPPAAVFSVRACLVRSYSEMLSASLCRRASPNSTSRLRVNRIFQETLRTARRRRDVDEPSRAQPNCFARSFRAGP